MNVLEIVLSARLYRTYGTHPAGNHIATSNLDKIVAKFCAILSLLPPLCS